jgi:hypothetical protein
MPRLKNPVNDATDLSAALERLGFKVTLLTNASRRAMNQAIVAFREALAQDRQSEGVFFFAGHGMQSRGVNYLIPVGAEIQAEVDLDDEAVSAQKILGSLEEARNRVNLVILDACRDNPLPSALRSSARGLAVVTSAPPETLILYSTAAGQTAEDGEGRNSPFAQALLTHIGDAGDVTQTVKVITGEVKKATAGQQTPYVYMGLSVDFALCPGSGRVPSVAQAAPEAKKPILTVEKAYGSITVDVKTRGTLYLNGESMGDLTPESSARLDNLEAGQARLEMRYPNGETESKQIEVPKNAVTVASFTYVEQQQPTVAPPQETLQVGVLPDFASSPVASIKLDGNFDDWNTIQPALVYSGPEKGSTIIDKVYLAVDSEHLYVRFDIRDDTRSSFFHPDNFNTSYEDNSYGVNINYLGNELRVQLVWNRGSTRWKAIETKESGVPGVAEVINISEDYRMKGSSAEAAFPLKPIRDNLGIPAAGTYYDINASFWNRTGNFPIAQRQFIF